MVLASQYLIYFLNKHIQTQMNNRFQVRQSTLKRSSVFSSTSNGLGRSFISTHLAQQSLSNGDDLRKSRIQNLPNYRKTNLGDNPNFVIIFQTIEIERLSSEIQVLRVKLKQAQRQLFNAQNYEVQIRQLTEKCFNGQNQLYQYRDQVEKLNKICETLYHQNQGLKSRLSELDVTLKQKYQSEKHKNNQLTQQIEKWKARYQATEKSKSKQLEDLRNLMECQRKSMIDRQIRQMTIRFQNQRSGLQNQIRKSREMFSNKNGQLQNLNKKCQKYQIQLMQMRDYQGRMNQLQGKINILSQELVRLNEVLRDKQDTIQQHKKIEYQINLKLKQQSQLQHEYQQLKGLLQSKNKEVEDWKVRSSRFQDQAIRGKQMVHFNNQLNDKLGLAGKQIDRVNSILRQKLDQIQKWKGKLQQKQMEITRLKNLENQLPQYQSKMNMLKAENDRINGILKSRLQQIQTWKKRSSDLQAAIAKFALLEKDKQAIQDRFNNQIKNHEQLKFSYSKLQNQLNSFKKYEQKCRQLESGNAGLNRQIDRLNNINRTNGNELNDYRQRFKQVQQTIAQYKTIQIQQKDYENKIILLTQQIERLNQLIKNKNQDIDQLQHEKLELHQKMNHYKNYQIKINENQQIVSKLQNNIEILKKEIQNWQAKSRSSEAKIRQLQNNLFAINSEKDKVSVAMRNKINEHQDLRNKYQNLQSDMRQLNDLKLVCQQQHNQIGVYLSDLKTSNRNAQDLQKQLNKERSKNQQANKRIGSMNLEFERLNKQLTGTNMKKAQQYDILQSQFSRVVSRSKSQQGEIQMLITKCTGLETQVRKLIEQVTHILKQVQKSEMQTQSLYKKIQQYQDYAKRISILDVQLNRLEHLNQGLEEDNKKMRLKYSEKIQMDKRNQGFFLATVLMAAQIESLRARLSERQVNMEDMRKSILQPVRRI